MNRIVKVLLCGAMLLGSNALLQAMDHGAATPSHEASANAASSSNANNTEPQETPECLICGMPLNGETITSNAIFVCHHRDHDIYHDSCMARWLQTKGAITTCPICRSWLRHDIDMSVPPFVRAMLEEIHGAQAVIHAPVPAMHNIAVPAAQIVPPSVINNFFAAARKGNVTRVLATLALGINVNTRNQAGKTALSIAAGSGRIAVTQILLAQQNIAVNARNANGKTALITAIQAGQLAAVETLLIHPDIDVNALDAQGNTPLNYAGRRSAIRALLIAHGAHE